MKVSSTSRNLKAWFKEPLGVLNRQLSQLHLSNPGIFELAMASGVFIIFLIYALRRAEQPFVHDSSYYWNLADSFLKDGEFSITNFSSGLRGYIFPFILFLLKSTGRTLGIDVKLLFYISSALYFSIFTIYILPAAFQSIFRWRLRLSGRATIAILVFFFWRGHFLYPLTDFPAFTALIISVAILSRELKPHTNMIWAFLIGFLISAAANIRPAYQISLIVLVPPFFVQLYKLKILKAIQWSVFFLLGCSIVLLPQFRINQFHFQVNSPWVLARFVGDENLFVKQLFWGLGTQKYETNIGENYSSAAAVYRDPLVDKLPANLLKDKTMAGYFKIIKRYPQDVAISYFRHFFNGIDVFFPTPYVKNLFSDHTIVSAVNYLVWFLASYYFIRTDFAHIDRVQLACVLALLAPVFLAIPTTVEVRFFLPIHILAYGLIAFGIDYTGLAASVRADNWNVLRLALVLSLWITVCFTLSAATIENLVLAP